MTLNPLKWAEWLINEHGSSSVLREHLGLLKSQLAVLETKIIELESKVAKLEKENEILTLENSKFKIEVENRKKMSGFTPQMF